MVHVLVDSQSLVTLECKRKTRTEILFHTCDVRLKDGIIILNTLKLWGLTRCNSSESKKFFTISPIEYLKVSLFVQRSS